MFSIGCNISKEESSTKVSRDGYGKISLRGKLVLDTRVASPPQDY